MKIGRPEFYKNFNLRYSFSANPNTTDNNSNGLQERQFLFDKNTSMLLKSNAFAAFSLNNGLFVDNKVLASLLENFHQVDPFYYRSAQPDVQDYPEIAKAGIKTIIDLRDNSEKEAQELELEAMKSGLNYVSIPMDPRYKPSEGSITEFFNVVNDKKNPPVLVHCRYGKDRTGVTTALYRIKKYGWDFNKAYQEMLDKGYRSWIFPSLKEYLVEYTNSKAILNNEQVNSFK